MFFNSSPFLIFFIVFFFLYWRVFKQNIKAQNLLILLGSYFFYAWWDWHFLFLLIGSSFFNYYLGIQIFNSENEKRRRLLLFLGLFQGIGVLFFFKYFNFFIQSFKELFDSFGIALNIRTLTLILPLGISFYSFRLISYLLDIDKGKIKPCTNLIVFLSYVAFFPSLVAGPIDRAKMLIPQFEKERVFNSLQAIDGLRQILWGLFKKLVVADNCAPFADHIFKNYESLPASSLVLGVFFYSIQMYADFSGYSDMAIGFARLIGFNITRNFAFPFFAQNISDYWQRWHISLTSWLTEYVFTPLSIKFRYYKNWGLILAIIINFIIVGLWHGANWTYVTFGILHSLYFIPLILQGKMNKKIKISPGKIFPSFKEFSSILFTYCLVLFAFVIFRAETISQAFSFFGHLCSFSIFSIPQVNSYSGMLLAFCFIFILFTLEWFQREKEYGLQINQYKSVWLRWGIYHVILFLIFYFGDSYSGQFIYAQF